jgi:D-3-phosphoglycerate dehydrogenase
LVVDPYLADDEAGGYLRLMLADALPQADIITFHSSGEECLIGEREIALMKTGVFLLNVARGGLIAEEAMVKALEEGKIAGAWLDTFKTEPYNGALCRFPNVILTPHVGSYTLECRKQMETEAVDNLLKALGKG